MAGNENFRPFLFALEHKKISKVPQAHFIETQRGAGDSNIIMKLLKINNRRMNFGLRVTPIALLVMVMQLGCGRTRPVSSEISDDDAISLLLSVSSYAEVSNFTDDGLSEFDLKYDYFPVKSDSFNTDILFRRRVESISSRITIDYDSSRTFATAVIAKAFKGRFVYDNNLNAACDTFSRPLSDNGIRYVWLQKSSNSWKVYGASPFILETDGPEDRVYIDSIKIEGDLGIRTKVTFLKPEAGQVLTREEMPIFYSGANIILNAWGRVESGIDSCWMFMHRREIDGGVSSHIRWPMTKQGVFEFQTSWASDSTEIPVVRHVAVDMILGATLFEDSTREYSACIWAIPYIITNTDSLP